MTALLWGVAGALIVDLVFLVAFVLLAPRLFRAAMRKQAGAMLGGFGSKASGSAVRERPNRRVSGAHDGR